MKSAQAAIEWLANPESQVSCHYLVHENGDVLQMVAEEKRAWHAGQSQWHGTTDINSRSVGIEIVNPGHDYGYPEFPEVQIASVIALCRDILARHAIPARHVLAHSDVAPGRKRDPGEKFPWDRLHKEGVGHWVCPDDNQDPYLALGDNGEHVAAQRALLAAYGYGLEIFGDFDAVMEQCVRAFQRHFRPSAVTGHVDLGTKTTLENLLRALEH